MRDFVTTPSPTWTERDDARFRHDARSRVDGARQREISSQYPVLDGTVDQNTRFPRAALSSARFKTYAVFISGISLFVFLNCGSPWVTATIDCKTSRKEAAEVVAPASQGPAHRRGKSLVILGRVHGRPMDKQP